MWYSDFISFYYSTVKTSELWEGHVKTVICKMDNQHRPIVQHIELCSMLCVILDGMGVWGRMDTCMYMTESFCCSPETTTALLIGYTPMQNVFGLKEKHFLKSSEVLINATAW